MLLYCSVGEDSRVPWISRRSRQSILKEISPEYSLEGLMLKLKLQPLGHLMQRTDSLKKTLMLEKIEGRRRGRQRMRWLDGMTDLMDISLSMLWWTENPGMLQSMGLQRVGHHWVTELTHIYVYIYPMHQDFTASSHFTYCSFAKLCPTLQPH